MRGKQRRVEAAEARRAAAKEKKQKKDNRVHYKSQVANLLTQLDKHQCASVRNSTTSPAAAAGVPSAAPLLLNVWTDVMPPSSGRSSNISSNISSGGTKEEQDEGKQKHARKTGKNKKRNSTHDASDDEEDEGPDPLLCRDHFYKGYCENWKQAGKKQGTCQHVHFSSSKNNNQLTLFDVLTKDQQEDLALAEAAAAMEDALEDASGSEMLYFFSIHLDDETREGGLGTLLSQVMAEKSCPHVSLVYVAFNDKFLFDRYRGGLLDDADLTEVFGTATRLRAASTSGAEDASNAIAQNMAGSLLEYILMFLPDTSVPTMIRVCTSWKKEIGTTSPFLWRQLLERRKWSWLSPLVSPSTLPSTADIKDTFVMHYQVVRDIRAVKEGLVALFTGPRKAALAEGEMVLQEFASRRNAPGAGNECIAVEIWSPGKAIACYAGDCTIRLFQTVEREQTSTSGGKVCKELVSVSVDPYRKTKKLNARMVAVGLDNDHVGCLLRVVELGTRNESYNIVFVSRDGYLEAAGGSEADVSFSELDEVALKHIDVQEAVVDFLLDSEEVDACLLSLRDFIYYGGERKEVEVLASHDMVPCGYNLFLIEVAISIPNDEGAINYGDDAMVLLGRKFVVFSSMIGSIVSLVDSIPQTEISVPRQSSLLLSSFRHDAGSQCCCSLVVALPLSPKLLNFEIERNGIVHSVQKVEAAAHLLLEENDREWQLDLTRSRRLTSTATDIITVDILFRDRGDNTRDDKLVVSFYPRVSDDNGGDHQTLVLDNVVVLFIERVQDQHIALFCEELKSSSEIVNPGLAEHDDDDDLFPTERFLSFAVFVIHVPTRQIIHREVLPTESHYRGLRGSIRIPLVLASKGATVCAGAWWKGIIMTGSDIRGVGASYNKNPTETDAPNKIKNSGKKKKQARVRIHGGKHFKGSGGRR